jgi:hypothetical protein
MALDVRTKILPEPTVRMIPPNQTQCSDVGTVDALTYLGRLPTPMSSHTKRRDAIKDTQADCHIS